MRFLLSIHDVWPGNFPLVSRYLARLRSLGARRTSLLVVPDYHGKARMTESREFLAWLREESEASDLFLHGWHHLMGEALHGVAGPRSGTAVPGDSGTRSAWGRWVNEKLVMREAEFCGLPRSEAEALLERGVEAFRNGDLPLAGFVAPTWHGSPPVDAMRKRGIRFWETRFRAHDLSDGTWRWAPALAWSAASGPDGLPSGKNPHARLLGGEGWLRAAMRLPLIKVAIHPGDLDNPETERILARVFAAGESAGYAEVFASAGRTLGNTAVTSRPA